MSVWCRESEGFPQSCHKLNVKKDILLVGETQPSQDLYIFQYTINGSQISFCFRLLLLFKCKTVIAVVYIWSNSLQILCRYSTYYAEIFMIPEWIICILLVQVSLPCFHYHIVVLEHSTNGVIIPSFSSFFYTPISHTNSSVCECPLEIFLWQIMMLWWQLTVHVTHKYGTYALRNYWQLNCLFNCLFKLTTRKKFTLHNNGHLWGEYTGDAHIMR